MPFDAKRLASDLLNAAYHAGGTLEVTMHVGEWSGELVREMVDGILTDRDQFKLRLRGIRTDTTGFAKFGIKMDTGNSGLYNGVPIVMSPTVDFDAMVLVFGPQQR